MTIAEKQSEIVKEFLKFPDWEDRYKLLIKKGKDLPKLDAEIRTDKYKVKGCQSSVWLHARKESGKIFYVGDSDAQIVKGLVSLLISTYSGHTPEEIMQTPPSFLDEIGINTHISQTRASGLAAMIKQIKLYAFALGQL